ncbi:MULTISPECIES: protein translocase subunit SecF [Actinomadura]|uniref:Protein-export membrane protein SecF n=1 Tax=Actinomadura litoris TaxID=2678616 RepID=A0A7K1LCU4_9ACTN|nr:MULTISPECIES: protein translocase subunit SecF [Actinomadura]MBT2214017.1 protein translocase subunit SecF [Actinomadura sp. NEAU-AAG7]MUN42238.1 protein translocase subunit SecF [Actinomadura litoris]
MGLRAAISRIYRGEISADIVGKPKIWYSISGFLLVLSIAGLLVQGLNIGVEFKGGSVFTFKASGHSIEDVRGAVTGGGAHQAIVQKAGGDWRVTTESLSSAQVTEVKKSVTQRLDVPESKVSTQVVGASWGGEIQKKAWQALVVFMILIIGYLSVAFEWRMALAAVVALVHDLVITAGVYAWSGFEVTPATLLGFLTILGYSLYDAVVVFDMIKEVTKPLTAASRTTYSEAANQALSSTLVRSLNTSLVAILPVGAILFIGTTLFGAGTLKDLSLALFVGMIIGTYSSLCVATPLLVQLKEREPKYKQIRANIARREHSAKRQAKAAKVTRATGSSDEDADDDDDDGGAEDVKASVTVRKVVQQGPRQQPKRGSRQQRRGK